MVASFSRTEQVDTPTPGTSTFTSTTQFHHGDNLGSISLITDENGLEVERLSYDAWGERRNPFTGGAYVGALPDLNRGFTKHEHLEEVGLIHMNGRVYDSVIGRFLSADPHVQKPFAAQNLNRYSYVLNNPLAYTDPDGFFFKKLFRAIKKVFKAIVRAIKRSPILRTALTLALAYFAAPLIGLEALSIGANVLSSAIVGGITDGVEGAIIGAARAAITYGIGDHLGGTGIGEIASRAAAHAVTSGVFAVAQGGESGPAALAAGFSVAVGGFVSARIDLGDAGELLTHSVIGGTASVIGGGKFQNGAATAAFVWGFNHLPHRNGFDACAERCKEPSYTEAQYRGHYHDSVVKALAKQLNEAGLGVVLEVPLQLGATTARIDMLVGAPGYPTSGVEVKTGVDPRFTPSQKIVYPHLTTGGMVTSPDTRIGLLGLTPHTPLPPIQVLTYYRMDTATPPVISRIKPGDMKLKTHQD